MKRQTRKPGGRLTLLTAIVTVNLIPSQMFRTFKNEVQQALARNPPEPQGLFTEAELSMLPAPVQRYFRTCGWIGKPKMSNASIRIAAMQLKMDLEKDFAGVKSYQFNSVAAPLRIAYLRSCMYGFIPFSGIDKYQDGTGNMYIKVMNLIPVVDLKGPEMNKAALVTVLAETFLAPSYALQPYMQWQALDDRTARATLTYNNTSVSGTFHFNVNGAFERFETTDRYMSQKDGSLKQAKWVAMVGNYQERNGVHVPSDMSAYWEIGGRLQQYAQMKISDVRFDVRCVEDVLFRD